MIEAAAVKKGLRAELVMQEKANWKRKTRVTSRSAVIAVLLPATGRLFFLLLLCQRRRRKKEEAVRRKQQSDTHTRRQPRRQPLQPETTELPISRQEKKRRTEQKDKRASPTT